MYLYKTKRLIISELTLQDASFILRLTNTAGWLQFIGDKKIRTIADAENYIKTGPLASYIANGHGLYLVTQKNTNAPIGLCGIIKRDTLPDKDIGFALLPEYTGNGYALEAAAAILKNAQDTLLLKRMSAITLPSNDRSIHLLTRLGFVFEKMVVLPASEAELMLFGKIF